MYLMDRDTSESALFAVLDALRRYCVERGYNYRVAVHWLRLGWIRVAEEGFVVCGKTTIGGEK